MKTKLLLLLLLLIIFLPEAHARARLGNRQPLYKIGRKYQTPKIPYNWVHVKSKIGLTPKLSKRIWKDTTAFYRAKGIRLAKQNYLPVVDNFPEHRVSCDDEQLCCVDYECIRTEMINYFLKLRDKAFFSSFSITHVIAPKIVVYGKEAIGGVQLRQYHKGGYSYSNAAETVNGKPTYHVSANAVAHEIGHSMYLYHIEFPINIMNASALEYVLALVNEAFLPLLDIHRNYMITKINNHYNKGY